MILVVSASTSAYELVERALRRRGDEVVAVRDMAEAIDALVYPSVVIVDHRGQDPHQCRSFLEAYEQRGCKVICLVPMDPSQLWCSALPADRRPRFLSVPCGEAELRAAVAQVVEDDSMVSLGDVTLDMDRGELQGDYGTVRLTPVELRLLQYLLQHRGAPVSCDELLREVWGWPEGTGSSEVIRAHIRNLRAKFRRLNAGQEIIRTFSRMGYGIPEESEVRSQAPVGSPGATAA